MADDPELDAYVNKMTPQQGALFAKCYAETGLEADKLAYTSQLASLLANYNAHERTVRHQLTEPLAFRLAIRFRKDGLLPKLRHRPEPPTLLTA